MNPKAELREQLAAIEHERWADWQQWVHNRLDNNTLAMSEEDYLRWQTQINTPYDQLSEAEKKSDMEQVDRYWPLIDKYAKAMVEKELEIVSSHLDDLHQGTEGAGFVHYGEMGEWIDNRLAELRKGGGE